MKDDLISRQAVLEKAINVPIAKVVTEDKVICRKIVFVDDIQKLPPVTPERKTGKWIRGKDGYIRCDKCGSRGSAIKAHYCHHCGAKMEV